MNTTSHALVVLAFMFSMPQLVLGASDMYLKIEGVEGETKVVTEASVSPTAMPVRANSGVVACTADAKMCPDGSAVGRMGPSCEFAPCPSTSMPGATGNPEVKVPPPPPPPRPSGDPDFDLGVVAPNPASPLYEERNSTESPLYESNQMTPGSTGASDGGKVNIAVGDVDGDGRAELVVHDLDRDGVRDVAIAELSRAGYIKIDGVDGEAQVATGSARLTIDVHAFRQSGGIQAPSSATTSDNLTSLTEQILSDATTIPTMQSVVIESGAIEITHEAQGRFLGIFRMSYSERVRVTSDGEVRVTLPWYSLLVNEDIDADVYAEATAQKKKDKPKEMQIESWSFGASQAGMYKAISDVMKAKHDTLKNSVGNIR